jgi:HK97 family phage major capsid protein
MDELKRLLEQQSLAFAAFKSANEGEREKIRSEMRALQKEIQAVVVKAQRPPAPGDSYPEVNQETKEAFARFARSGDTSALYQPERKASGTTGIDPDGGYMVPVQTDNQITMIREKSVAMRRVGRVLKPETPEYKKLVSTGGTASGWVGETEARPETAGPQLAVLTPAWGGLYANPAATQDLIEDSAFDIEEWYREEVSKEFSSQEGEAFITGNGIKKPRGITTFPMGTATDATRAFGTIQYIASGIAGALPANPDSFIDVIYALKAKFRQNARWLMNSLTMAAIRKYKDGEGNYMWQPSLIAGQPSTFMGYPVEEDDFMPDVAADSIPILFGDYQQAFWIFDRPTTVIRDPYTNKPYVHFYTATRVGSMLANSEAVKAMKMAVN